MKEELMKELEKMNKWAKEFDLVEYRLIFEEDKIYFIGEFDYEEGERNASKLDKILQKYNKNWYFDAECSGRWVAFLN